VRAHPPIYALGCLVALVIGAVPEDRYECKLVLTASSVRCQAKIADLLPSEIRMTRGSARSGAAVHQQPPAPYHPGQVPVACLLVAGLAGRQRRAPAPLRRAPLPGQRGHLPGRSLGRHCPDQALDRDIQRFGCPACQPFRRDSGVSPGIASGRARCLPCRHLHVCRVSRRLPRAGSPGCAGRRSVVAEGGMPHPRHTRSARCCGALAVHAVSCRTGPR